MQISEIKMADIPDIDLTTTGVSKYGTFTVEVIDPVVDYLELLEVRSWRYVSLENLFGGLCIYSFVVFCAECIWFPAY